MPLLNSYAPISLAGTTTGQSVAQELLNTFDSTGLSSTSTISFNDQRVRQVAGKVAVANQPVTMPTDFLNKNATFPYYYGTFSPTGSKIRVYSFGYFYASSGSYVSGTNGAGLQFNDTGSVGSGSPGTTSSVYTTGSIGVYADAYPNFLYIPQYWKWLQGDQSGASYYLMRVNFSSYSGPSGMLLQIGNSGSYENVTLGTTSNEYYLSSNPFVRWVSNPTYPWVYQTGTYIATGTIYIKNTANASTGYARLEESITFSFSTYWEYVNDGDYGGGGG
jgi:hypothetical protein